MIQLVMKATPEEDDAFVEAAEQRLRAYCAIYFVEVSESDEEYPDPEPDLLEPPVSKSNRSN